MSISVEKCEFSTATLTTERERLFRETILQAGQVTGLNSILISLPLKLLLHITMLMFPNKLISLKIKFYYIRHKTMWVSKVFDTHDTGLFRLTTFTILAKIFVIRSFFCKNGYLLIFFACQKIINPSRSKLRSDFYTFDTCILKSIILKKSSSPKLLS